MTHLKRRWHIYTLIVQAAYMLLNPGPVHSLARALLCND